MKRKSFSSDVFLSLLYEGLKVLWMKISSQEIKHCSSSVDGMKKNFFEVIVGDFEIGKTNIIFVHIYGKDL